MTLIRIAQTLVLLVFVGLPGVSPICANAAAGNDGEWLGLLSLEVHGHTAIYDPLRDRMLVFGMLNEGLARPTSDVWTLSFSGNPTWMTLVASGTPPGRGAHAAIYDPVRDRMIIFGGRSAHGLLNDVWALDLSGSPAWTQLSPTGSPPAPRDGPTAVYDSERDRMVVFGGRDANGRFNDAWALTLSGIPSWSPLNPAGLPPSARFGHTACVDPGRDRMLIFGGFDGGHRNDVWELTLSGTATWHELSPSGGLPVERHSHTAIYDPAGDRMVVFGGLDASPLSRNDVWALSLSGAGSWGELTPQDSTPSVREDHTAIYDPVRNRMVAFGGFDGYNEYRSDAWAFALSGSPAWSQLPLSTVRPPGMYRHSVIYDPLRDRMIAYGNGELWALTLSSNPTWNMLTASGTPPPLLAGHTAIYDPVRDRMIVFGGYYLPTGGHNQTWALTLSGSPAWINLNTSNAPPDRRYDGHSAIYDPIRDRMVIFYYPSDLGDRAVWALSLSGTPTWGAFVPSGARPPGRERHFAFYDPVRDRMVVYGGGQSYYLWWNDVWALTLSGSQSWIQLTPSGAPPPPRRDPAAIYDSTRKRMILFGGYDNTFRNDVWELALVETPTWREMAPPGGPPSGRYGQEAIYDRVNDRMMMFGGDSQDYTPPSDLWALSWRQEATDVTEPRSPTRLVLQPARPNPARSSIELRYELSTDEHISLDVLDVQGRLMRRLRNGAQPAGVHSVAFDRRDDGGGRLAAGIYLVRLRTRTEARVTRIVVLP